ncbi:MAG: LysR family transcriptional regulator, repressor for citA [Eubacteriaceae bacterium]|nr:LysR family transcriptional regulator, repressor for citA [Eubacteriaceae bacterium]
MDTQILKTYLALCRYKSFSRTADALFITQSTVSKRIAELEGTVQQRLFERDKKHVSLTEEGMIFMDYAERMVALEAAAIKKINSHKRFENYLRVGATNSIYESHLVPLIAKYLDVQTNAVKIVIGHSSELLFMLQDQTLDVVFSYFPFNKAGLDCRSFHRDELVLVTSFANCQYADGIFQSQLQKTNYLMCNFALKAVGTYIRELFPKHYSFSFEIDNSTKLIPYLISGTGYSFLPLKMVEAQVKAQQLRIIPLIDFQIPVIESYCIGRANENYFWQELLNTNP